MSSRADPASRSVVIRDIAARLAGQAHDISTSGKIELIDRLTGAGVSAIEVSSFVRADLIPGLSDADEVFRRITRRPGVSFECCVGNVKGLERAIDAGVDVAWFLLSADEQFAMNNTGRTTSESLVELERMCTLVDGSSTKLGTYIIFAWGGPSSPPRRPADLEPLARRLVDIGVRDWILADSCGYASPSAAEEIAGWAVEVLGGPATITIQIHDGRGMGLACIRGLMNVGISRFDAALAGSGGHPAMKATPGFGLCTEDLVQMLELEGVRTGIDLRALVDTSNWLVDEHDVPARGFTRLAGPVPRAAERHVSFEWSDR